MWRLVPLALLLVACGPKAAAPEPTSEPPPEAEPAAEARFDGLEGFWTTEQANALLERSEPLVLDADTSVLSEAERGALTLLMEVGETFHALYAESRHADATAVRAHLAAFEPTGPDETARLEALRALEGLFQGPLAFTLESAYEPFAPVEGFARGRNVYPRLEEGAVAAYLKAHPEQRALGAVRTVVRQRTEEALAADRATMEAHPWLEALHPELPARLEGAADPEALYAAPYALAYADAMSQSSGKLHEAAGLVRAEDPDLADFLEQRARDLLTNDYEAGDAAWVRGRTRHLNAELGAYETYDDKLLGQKAFFAASLLLRNAEASAELESAVAGLADHEAALPGGPYERVQSDLPIGVYDVIADYGQCRGGNTATILPNEAHVTRKYGRTILLRRNVMENPAVVAAAQRRFRAAVAAEHADDLGPSGNFDRTVWHEVGHYLGPKTTTDDRTVGEALGPVQNHFEEMKADLVSLWMMPRLVDAGILTPERRDAAYAGGVLRSLVTSEPPRTSPYQTMRLMQQNWLFERGVLRMDAGRLRVDYAAMPAAIEAMLTEVLSIQRSGDRDAANAFIERWARWDDAVQGVLGRALDGASHRYWRVSFAALEG
ncbi:MAG: NUDIX hydrolase [Myxococcota bacterium]